MSTVTFTINVEEAAKIEAIMAIMLGTAKKETNASKLEKAAAEKEDKPVKNTAPKKKVVEEVEAEAEDLEEDADDELEEVTAEAVKIALKAYAKENGRDEAKEIMTANKLDSLSAVDKATKKQLTAIMNALI